MASDRERMMVEAELLNIEEQITLLKSLQSRCQEEKSVYQEREVPQRGKKKGKCMVGQKRSLYVRPENVARDEEGEYCAVSRALKDKDDEKLVGYFLLSADAFIDLANRLKPIIKHQSTHRQPIHIRERLAVTLRILASGETQSTVANAYKLSQSTVCGIVMEVCKALWTTLQTDFLPCPTVDKWEAIKADFWQRWNFPNCVGGLGAKRVNISPNIPTIQRMDLPLLAVVATCDARYRFTTMEVLTFQKESYGDLFKNSTLGSKLQDGNLDLPPPASVSEFGVSTPDLFVADAAFPLTNNLMCPFQGTDLSREEQIYNLHHSRVMRVIENTFGILTARWRILTRPLEHRPDKVTTILKACIVLHNFLASNDDKSVHGLKYIPANFADTDSMGSVQPGEWRQVVSGKDQTVFDSVCPQQFASSNNDGIDVRNTLMDYLNLVFHF